jgi:hypothetical protein
LLSWNFEVVGIVLTLSGELLARFLCFFNLVYWSVLSGSAKVIPKLSMVHILVSFYNFKIDF